MTKINLLLFSLLLNFTAVAQLRKYELNISDISYVQKNDIDKVNDYLIRKGWNLKEMKENGSIDDYDQEAKYWPGVSAKWVFKDNLGRIVSVVSYDEATDYNFPENKGKELPISTDIMSPIKSKKQVKVAYMFYDRTIFTSIKDKVEALGYKKSGSSIASNSIQSTYYNSREIIRFATMNKSQQQYFVIHLLYNTGNIL